MQGIFGERERAQNHCTKIGDNRKITPFRPLG
jgi:hypothetical protein